MRVKVSVLGHFGEGEVLLNGQTVKTKIVTEELIKQLGEEQVVKIDTHGGAKVLLKAPFAVLGALKKSANVLIFPAHNGLRVYAPLLSLFRPFFKGRKLHYSVIGGWLPNFLEKRRFLKKCLKKFDGIYTETDTMKKALDAMGFENVFVVPNCKYLKIVDPENLSTDHTEPYKLCTFSRVMKEKGIEDAVNAVKSVNEKMGRTVYCLDIYGQIDGEQVEWFEDLRASFPEYIRYAGLVPFDKSVDVLKDYFALLFPTYYDGEGFAGTVIDAYAAGLPVVASDWKYNPEIVRDGETGLIFKVHDPEMFTEKLICLLDDQDLVTQMRGNCINEAEKYLPSRVVKIIIERMA